MSLTPKRTDLKFVSLGVAMAGLITATGCASGGAAYQPIVDGPTGPAYQADLADCQQVAEQRQYDNSDTRTSATIGAGLGGIIGLAEDGDIGEAAVGAVVGGLFGGGAGALETREERAEIVKNCMAGRGHRVVG